jgi:hypothetical protein
MNDLVKYLQGCSGITKVQAVHIAIGRRKIVTYEGAMYQDERWGRRIYVIGDLPPSYKRSSNVVYKYGIGPSDTPWFIAGFYNCESLQRKKITVTPEIAKMHPFGDHFTLALQEPIMAANNPRVVPMVVEVI